MDFFRFRRETNSGKAEERKWTAPATTYLLERDHGHGRVEVLLPAVAVVEHAGVADERHGWEGL